MTLLTPKPFVLSFSAMLKLLSVAMLLLVPAYSAFAEGETTAKSDSLNRGFLPLAGFSTETGFGLGGMYQSQRYADAPHPLRELYQIQGSGYTTLNLTVRTRYKRRFGEGRRFESGAELLNVNNAYYFGLGPGSVFDKADFEDGFNEYSRILFRYFAEFGYSLGEPDFDRRIEWFSGFSLGYVRHSNLADTQLGIDRPDGSGGGFRQSFYTGLRADYRRDLFRPDSGSLFTLKTSLYPSALGNRRTVGKISGSASFYRGFHLITDVVAAGRIGFEQVAGSAPYYELAHLGGEQTLRGFLFERFRDKGAVYTNLELRTWLFSLPIFNLQIGGQLFTDIGTVYGHPFEAGWHNNLKTSAGLGGTASLFNRDFIVRGDLGFSSEGWAIYTGLGYMF